MLEKYVEERFPRYITFGGGKDGKGNVASCWYLCSICDIRRRKDGKVNVASTHYPNIASVTRNEAALLIKDRDRVVDALVRMAQAFDEANAKAFDAFWYVLEIEKTRLHRGYDYAEKALLDYALSLPDNNKEELNG